MSLASFMGKESRSTPDPFGLRRFRHTKRSRRGGVASKTGFSVPCILLVFYVFYRYFMYFKYFMYFIPEAEKYRRPTDRTSV